MRRHAMVTHSRRPRETETDAMDHDAWVGAARF